MSQPLRVASFLLTVAAAASSQTPPDLRKAAARIDELAEQAMAAHQLTPGSIIDDATFVRRAFLAVAGRIPTAAEALAFHADAGSDKRTALIDKLLQSPGHQSHESNWWADLLRARSRLMRQTSGEPFLHWIKESVAQNKPYDQMVREMLTAEGAAHARDNGASGYLLRDLGMPLDNMANTLRVFAGTRLECAQCHNHPFDKWKQTDFFSMAAFMGGLRYQAADAQGATATLRRMAQGSMTDSDSGRTPQAQQAVRRLIQNLGQGLSGSGTGLVRLPNDYKYTDHKPNQPVVAKALFGNPVALDVQVPPERRGAARGRQPRPNRAGGEALGKEVGSRAAFAAWLTAPDNPRFALVMANRMWQRFMGRGLIEPVDGLRDDTQASIPELMEYLTRLLVDLRFDLRQFERVLLTTRLFQRAAPATELESGAAWLASGPLLDRMSAEQLWDSLLTLVVRDLDGRLQPAGARAEEVYKRYESLAKGTPEQIQAAVDEELLRVTNPQKYRQIQMDKRAAEQKERTAQMADKQAQARPLMRELAVARRKGDEAAVAKIMAQLRELGVPLPGERRNQGEGQLVRASDLPQPAPPGHLLRQLGQSDRETIDSANREANVPQVLSLLNGFCERNILQNPGSVLAQELAAAKTPGEKVRVAYLTVLARVPSSSETETWTAALQKDGDLALRDLVWLLINSHEFRFVR